MFSQSKPAQPLKRSISWRRLRPARRSKKPMRPSATSALRSSRIASSPAISLSWRKSFEPAHLSFDISSVARDPYASPEISPIPLIAAIGIPAPRDRDFKRNPVFLMGILFGAQQVKRNIGLVTDHPAIVTRCNLQDVAPFHLNHPPTIHAHISAPA